MGGCILEAICACFFKPVTFFCEWELCSVSPPEARIKFLAWFHCIQSPTRISTELGDDSEFLKILSSVEFRKYYSRARQAAG